MLHLPPQDWDLKSPHKWLFLFGGAEQRRDLIFRMKRLSTSLDKCYYGQREAGRLPAKREGTDGAHAEILSIVAK
ncbi:uncharacterized [Tachysurus ichikawai]